MEQETLEYEAEAVAALYGYVAAVFLEEVPVPGIDWAQRMLSPTRQLASCLGTAPGASDLQSWCDQVERASANGLEALQREAAVDRTRLCRGVDGRMLPPYESYWAGNASEGGAAGTSRAYAQANIHFAHEGAERDDFIGVELAFLAHLAREERTADDRERRRSFEREHLFTWLPAYCDAAGAVAETALFRGLLAFLGAYAREE